jgi:hypothetical protein
MDAPQKSRGRAEPEPRGRGISEVEIKDARLPAMRRTHRHPHGPAMTSARAIRSKQRQSEVLTYRLNGYSYAAIAKQMHIAPSTAHDYAVKAIQTIVPVEDARQVLAQELLKLDAMQAAVYQDAVSGGDKAAIDAMLKIITMRARLLGLFPGDGKPSLHLSIGGGDPAGNAADTGIRVTFVRPHWPQEDSEPAANGPVIDHSEFNGKKA